MTTFQPHVLPVLKYLNQYLDDRPLCCCVDEISDLKKPGISEGLVNTYGHLVHDVQVQGIEGEGGGARAYHEHPPLSGTPDC